MLNQLKALKSKTIAILLACAMLAQFAPATARADEQQSRAPSKAAIAAGAVAENAGAEATELTRELQSQLRASRYRFSRGERVDNTALFNASTKAHYGLKKFKASLETAADGASADDIEALQIIFGLIRAYYSQKALLHVATEAFGSSLGTNGGGGVSLNDLKGLELVLPSKLAEKLAEIQGKQISAMGGESFDTSYVLSDAGKGKKRLTLHPRDVSAYRMAALTSFPSKGGVNNILQFLALKSIFVKEAVFSSYLYGDEEVDTRLPEGTDPYLEAMKAHAQAFASETALRRWMSPALVQPVVNSILAKRSPEYASAVKQAFRLLYDLMPHHADDAKLGKFGGTPEALAEKFLMLERDNMATAIHTTLKTLPGYLTEMTRDDLKAALERAAVLATANLALVALDRGMLDLSALEESEDMAVTATVMTLGTGGVADGALNDFVVADFLKIRETSNELSTAFRRYELATKAIAATEVLEALKASLKEVEKIAEGGEVPARVLPKQPDPGVTLLALNYGDKIPVWFAQVLQSLGSKTRSNKPDQIRKLKRMLDAFPGELLKHAQRVEQNATTGAVGILVKAHRVQMQKIDYRSASPEARMVILARKTPSEQAKKVIKGLQAMIKLADAISADALRTNIQGAFQLLTEGRANDNFVGYVGSKVFAEQVEGINYLLHEIKTAQAFLEHHKSLLGMIFTDDIELRAKTLKNLIRNKENFINYVTIRLHELEAQFPLIFQPIPLWKKGQQVTGNADTITFGEFVIGLKKAANLASLEVSIGQAGLDDLTEDVSKKPEQLSDTMKLGMLATEGLTPRDVAVAAAMGSGPKKDLWTKVMDGVVDTFMDDGSSRSAPMEDQFWPTHFKTRDFIAAKYDKGASLKTKTLRILVSTFMAPWLRSGVLASKDEQTRVITGKPNELKKQWEMETYNMVQAEVGEQLGGMLSEMHEDATSRKFRNRLKSVTMRLQEGAHYAFYGMMFVSLPMEVHTLLGRYMGLSAFFDLSADILAFADFWSTYSALRPYAYSGALGGGLVRYSTVQQQKDQMYEMAHVLLNRIPFDIWFFGQLVHGESMRIRMGRVNKKVALELSKLGIERREFDQDYYNLMIFYQMANVHAGTKPGAYAKLYAKKVAELKPLADQGRGDAKAALESLTMLKTQMDAFEKKYPTIAPKVVGAIGKSGFKSDKDLEVEKEHAKMQQDQKKDD